MKGNTPSPRKILHFRQSAPWQMPHSEGASVLRQETHAFSIAAVYSKDRRAVLQSCVMGRDLLNSRGFFLLPIELPPGMRDLILDRDWKGLDQMLMTETRPGGSIHGALTPYARFSGIEFIISIRSSLEYPDEDGIWH